MRTVAVAEATSQFSALLAAVENGEEVAITRRGRVIARLIPDAARSAADVFRPCRQEGGLDLSAPADTLAEPAVIMSLNDCGALEGTAYLLRSPKGAQRLMMSVEQLRAGDGEPAAIRLAA